MEDDISIHTVGTLISNHDKVKENGSNLPKTKRLGSSALEKCVRVEQYFDSRGGPITWSLHMKCDNDIV